MAQRCLRIARILGTLGRVLVSAAIAVIGFCATAWAALFRCPVLALLFFCAGALAAVVALCPRRLGQCASAPVVLGLLIAFVWRTPVREVDRSIARLAAIPRAEDALDRFSLRDKLGIYGLNLAMGITGLALYPEAAAETLWLAVPGDTSRRRVYHSDFPMRSQRISAVVRSFADVLAGADSEAPQLRQQRVAWPASASATESRVRLALDPCAVRATARRAGSEWTLDVEVEVRVAYPRNARTCVLREPELCVEEGLFWVLQETRWLHPYTAVWSFSRRVQRRAGVQLPRHILQLHTSASPERCSRDLDPPEELRMVLESILEPIILRLKPDQHARRSPVARNQYLLVGGQPQIPREVILHLRQSYPARLV